MFYDTFKDFIHIPGEEKRDGSFIGIALKARNTTIGIIGMDSSTKYGPSVGDMDFTAILAYLLAVGIEKSRFPRESSSCLSTMVLRDSITIGCSWKDLSWRSTDCMGPEKHCRS